MLPASNTCRLAGVLLLVMLSLGCTIPPQTHALLGGPAPDIPTGMELRDTPFHPQERYQCGPAALATVLGAHAVEVTPEELTAAVYVPELQGSLPVEMAAAARSYAMLAYPLPASLELLLTEVAAGNPVLVFQNLGGRRLPRMHFAVVIGYDLGRQEIILRSGTTRRWHSSLATFERTWSGGDYWAMVILPAGRVPATAEPVRYLQAARDLEASAQSDAARLAYRAATRRWPREPRTWMMLGNHLYAAGDYPQALAAFSTVTGLVPDDPRGWNNLAYVLLQTTCPQQARIAAACAAGLAPHDRRYLDTLTEIGELALGDDAPQCMQVRCAPPPETGGANDR